MVADRRAAEMVAMAGRTLGLVAVTVAGLLLGGAASAPSAAADAKAWRHGFLEAKSDAGIIMMPSRGGFAERQGLKLELVQVKSDVLGLQAERLVLLQRFAVEGGVVVEGDAVQAEVHAAAALLRRAVEVAALDVVERGGAERPRRVGGVAGAAQPGRSGCGGARPAPGTAVRLGWPRVRPERPGLA